MSSSIKQSNSLKLNVNTDRKIKLIATQEKYRVKLQEFIKCSLKIQKDVLGKLQTSQPGSPYQISIQLWETGRLPKFINLSAYDELAVKTLVGYIQNDDQKSITLSFYALADLIDLSRSLLMLGLLQQLEQILVKIASQETDSLIQALIIIGSERSISFGLTARQKIEEIAANKFQHIVQHKHFASIPPIIFANILARCDLNIKEEMNVVDAAILWIWQQEKPLINSALVFSHIRSVFLTRGDFRTIQELLKTLPNGERIISLIMTTLYSTFCRRCCLIKEHLDKELIRCGIPKLPNDVDINLRKLPLSRKLSIKQIREEKNKSKKSREQLAKKEKTVNRKNVKDMKRKMIETSDESSKSIRSKSASAPPSPSSKPLKSDKTKTSEDSKENIKNKISRRGKLQKPDLDDSGQSRKLRNAMRKKIYSDKTKSDD